MIHFARIDERLIHGQVATSWVPVTKPTHLLVIDDQTANDPMESMITKAVAPPSVKTEVLTVAQAITRLQGALGTDPKAKTFLLFKGPEAPLALIRGGIQLGEINLGNIYQRSDRTAFRNATHLNEAERDCFRQLLETGAKVYHQCYPKDAKFDISKLL